MTNQRLNSAIWLKECIGWDAKEYLPDECKKLLLDWHILEELISTTKDEVSFYDYSFIMAPVYKAIESVLWKISEDLNLIKDGVTLGAFFNDDNIDKNIKSIEEKINEKDKIAEIKNILSELKTMLKRYRHKPAHSNFILKTLNEAEIAAKSGLYNIGCLVNELLSLNLIVLPKKQIEEEIEMPF